MVWWSGEGLGLSGFEEKNKQELDVKNAGCNRRVAPLIACLGLILCQTAAAETWYRWVDAKGAVHVEREHPMGASYDQVQIPDPIPEESSRPSCGSDGPS